MSKLQFTWIHLVFKIQTYFCKLVLKIKHLQKAQCFSRHNFYFNLRNIAKEFDKTDCT